jgi:catechol 2,3-dioxygenase-like lactoylglutathione lyase family enzyme
MTTLAYAIKFVGDMSAAVRFHTDQLGLNLRFQSPEWSEFDTGTTTLALHLASPEHPPGTCQLGFHVPDVAAFYVDRTASGVTGVQPPVDLHGQKVARLLDPDGAEFSVGGQ